ncbi:MAG: LD-carboxypeptidase [Bdellovibrionaceae bacterium]|nr:LD-carboxypeptidase [Pseudobdellovibrionaceae bacterium]
MAPGSSAPAEALQRGVEVLKSWGLRVRVPENLIVPTTFFANTDEERLRVLKTALHAKDSRAVWFVRGGSGTHRLLPGLFKGARPKTPKLILGFSDATSLLNGALKHWKWPTLHAPVLTQLGRGELDPADVEDLRRLLFGEEDRVVFEGLRPLNDAARKLRRLSGEVIGGNLTVYQNLIGVPEAVKPAGKIVFFEEINERGYRIDRTLTHLRQAKFFDGAKAVVLGDFIGGDEPTASTATAPRPAAPQPAAPQPAAPQPVAPVNRVEWAMQNFARDLRIPLFAGLPVGHGNRNRPVPFGTTATIQGDRLVIASPLTAEKSPAGKTRRKMAAGKTRKKTRKG